MDIELKNNLLTVAQRLVRVASWLLVGISLVAPGAKSQRLESVLILNAERESQSCLWPLLPNGNGLVIIPDFGSNCPYQGDNRRLFLRQGKRTELRVFNRKFLTDYSITIDNVTGIQSLPNIRNLDEAQNLSLGSATLIGAPTAKGGSEGLTPRTTAQVLFQLLDESTATKPIADLDADRAVIEREKARIYAEKNAFDEAYRLLTGELAGSCQGMTAAPDIVTLRHCLAEELSNVSSGPRWVLPPFTDEDEFRRVVLQVQDLIAAVKALSSELTQSDLPGKIQKFESDVAQYENDVIIFLGNKDSSQRAARLANDLVQSPFRRALRREQLKAFLAQQLKNSPSSAAQNPQDEAELNELLDLYQQSSGAGRELVRNVSNTLNCTDAVDRHPFCNNDVSLDSLNPTRVDLQSIKTLVQVALLGDVDDVNKAQSSLLNRVNYLYDNSEIREPLVKDIDISKYSGNVIVYYTIRRIETFTRFTISPVPGSAGVGTASAALTPPPPTKGGTPSDNSSPPPAAAETPGIVVSKGSFEVHSFFRANVGAAFVYSTLKDQDIAMRADPLGCTGTVATPDTTCFTPILNGTSHQIPVMLAVDWYPHERDTFPRDKYADLRFKKRYLCSVDIWQCIGPMGGVSMNHASSYFLGGFIEPTLGVQIYAGVNFGSQSTLAKSYQFGTPADVTGNFSTYQKRATGAFVGVGLDLAIFSKIFGKVTGVGIASSTATTKGN